MAEPKYTYKCLAMLQTELTVMTEIVATDELIEHLNSLASSLDDEHLRTTALRLVRMKELSEQDAEV